MTVGEDVKVCLTESVLENKNLEMVLAYLEESSEKQVIITDYKGKIYTGIGVNAGERPDNLFLSLPCRVNESGALFDKDTERFFYKVGSGEKDGFIIINDVEPDNCEKYLELLDKASLAVRSYLAQLAATESIENLYANNFITDVLLRNINIKDLMKNNSALLNLDLNNLYYVTILEPERTLSEREIHTLYSYTKEWLAYTNLDIYCTVWDNKNVVCVCPTHYDQKMLEVDFSWTRHINNITKYFKDVTTKFNCPSLMGIGNKYSLSELHHSYQEATITIQISKHTGKRNMVRHFSELGIFTLICKHEFKELKEFCDKYLGSVLEHDRNLNRELLDSLRYFFDANLDVKEAAERLHMHINTLRYRLRKIEELSGINLQEIEHRANLYVALKIYELLQSTEIY